MSRLRLLFLVAGALVIVLLAAITVSHSSFQTWLARKMVASHPEVHTSIGRVSAGLKRIELRDLRFEHGGAVLTVPLVELELPLWSAGWSKRVRVSQLLAKGWTLDLTKLAEGSPTPVKGAPSQAAPAVPLIGAASFVQADAARQEFAGVFTRLALPVDFSLDGVRLEGEVLLPEARGRSTVRVAGGGLEAGREGKFEWTADAALTGAEVNAVRVGGTLSAAMDTPRSFTRIAATLDAAATGARFPNGVKLHGGVTAVGTPAGETYTAAVETAGREILNLRGGWLRQGGRLEGGWKVAVRDEEVSPFVLGQPLPAFNVAGEGQVDADARFTAIHVLGKVGGTVNRLEVLAPQLAAVGELKIAGDFDLAKRGGAIVVQRLLATMSAATPIASVRALQPFEFDIRTGTLRASDTAQDLLGIVLQGVPVAWAKPFFRDLDLTGGQLKGEFAAVARGGGMTLHSLSPLLVEGLALGRGGQSLVRQLDVAMSTSADYTPQGWQAEVSRLTVRSGEATLLSLTAKAGQLAGPGQPVKATGELTASLPALLAQPFAASHAGLSSGEAQVSFVGSMDGKKEIQASVELRNLAVGSGDKAVKLPAVSTQLRADVSPDGRVAFNAPLRIDLGDRHSDLTAIGTIAPEKDSRRAIEAELTSVQLHVGDAQLLAALLPARTEPSPGAPRDTAPPWAGFHGSLALRLKSVTYSDTLQFSNVNGRLRIEEGTLKLEGWQAGMGDGGRASLGGAVTFDASAPKPYAVAAEVGIRGFDASPMFHGAEGHPPTVEGKFDISSRWEGRAPRLVDLASGVEGNIQITSKGGVFRGLPVNVGTIVENTNWLAAWIASAGTALSAMAGRKDFGDVASKGQAVAELARGLNPIPYDQLSVVLSRDAAMNTTLREFTLISPELRLTGGGTALHKPGSSLLQDSLAMEFTLRVRGRPGELLKYLGALHHQTDDLGYAACTVPLVIGGTLSRPETAELNGRLTALALEKSGLGDKAAELLSKIRGGGK